MTAAAVLVELLDRERLGCARRSNNTSNEREGDKGGYDSFHDHLHNSATRTAHCRQPSLVGIWTLREGCAVLLGTAISKSAASIQHSQRSRTADPPTPSTHAGATRTRLCKRAAAVIVGMVSERKHQRYRHYVSSPFHSANPSRPHTGRARAPSLTKRPYTTSWH